MQLTNTHTEKPTMIANAAILTLASIVSVAFTWFGKDWMPVMEIAGSLSFALGFRVSAKSTDAQ